MKILIISVNRNRQPVPVFPYGACIVAEAAEKNGHSVKLLDLMFEKNPLQAVQRELSAEPFDVVGLSIRNIDNNDILHPRMLFSDVGSISDIIRRESKAEIVIGGAAVGVLTEQFLRLSGASFAVLANGETVFPEFLSAQEKGEDPHHCKGIAWMEEGIFKKNINSQKNPNEHCITPDFSRWLDIHSYFGSFSSIPIQTKRGCPFNCIYCTYAISEGREYRIFNPESVVDGIGKYCSQGLRDIEFVDNVFNSPLEQSKELCDLITKSGLKPRLQTMEMNPKFIDHELISVMESSGFVGMGITAESASDEVLERLGKNYYAQDVQNSADIVHSHHIPCFWMFMLGGPGETRETVRETLNFAGKCIRKGDAAFFNIGIRIYPGTSIEEITFKEGLIDLHAEDMLTPVFYVSPQVGKLWLIKTVSDAVNHNMQFISQETFALPYLQTLMGTLQRFGVSQPVWKYTGRLRKTLKFMGIKT